MPIKESLEVDFYVDPRPLTKEEELALSNHIKLDKQRRLRMGLINKESKKVKQHKHLQVSNKI
jgi:hypothetical protein